MNSSLIEILKPRTSFFVSKGISDYESSFGNLNSEKLKVTLEQIFQNILLIILDRLEKNSPVSILPFESTLLSSVIKIGISSKYPIEVLGLSVNNLEKEVRTNYPNTTYEFLRVIREYVNIIEEYISNKDFLLFYSGSKVLEIIRSPNEYQYSDKKAFISQVEVDPESGRVFTLFPKSRYWETFKNQSSLSVAYSPLSYNRTAISLGKGDLSVDINYHIGLIKDGEFYKLNSGVGEPTRNSFDKSEWTKSSSTRLLSHHKFNSSLDKKIKEYILNFFNYSPDINSIISNSEVKEYKEPYGRVYKDNLTRTFGGEGKAIYESIQKLKESSKYFGGYEGSRVGALDYIAKFSDYLISSSYGRNRNSTFAIIDGEDSFGDFTKLFLTEESPDRIPGLAFLDGFTGLKSFIHGQKINVEFDINDKTISYNPVASRFSQGITDRYKDTLSSSTYTPVEIDVLLQGVESAYSKCLYCGDLVFSSLKSLDNSGKMPGYEGLGSTYLQLTELQNVFPPSSIFTKYLEDEQNDVVYPGLTGGILAFLKSYSRLQASLVSVPYLGSLFRNLAEALLVINEQIKEVISSVEKLGVEGFSFIPNISISNFNTNDKAPIEFLRSLGFRDSEIERVNSVETFSELIEFFAPLSDSSDLKSFFKGFELTQLLYELGGQEAIDSYLGFLYQKSDIDGLLNILSVSQRNKSRVTTLQTSKYPTLIGLLIGLTYAIDPAQLVKFSKILGENNLSLLDSISYLLQSGQSTLIKSKEDIEVLQPVIDQVIQGSYKDPLATPDLSYSQVNSIAPIGLKQWTKLINQNLGNIDSKAFIEFLYDKSIGLTPKELLVLLGGISSNTVLGQILDGFGGGSFNKFLKYANITGIGMKLSSYKNSYQLNNFSVENVTQFGLVEISTVLKDISDLMIVMTSVIEANSEYESSTESSNNYMESLLFAQNKTVEDLNKTISSLLSSTDKQNVLDIKGLAGNGRIQESPGIGNSRRPNRIPLRNSITPEQFQAIFSQSSGSKSSINYGSLRSLPSGLINNFIKFAEDNKLINSVSTVNESIEVSSQEALIPSTNSQSWKPATEFDTIPQYTTATSSVISSVPYSIPEIYKVLEDVMPINQSTLGAVNIQASKFDGLPSTKLSSVFNPIESCKRFGGENCEELYESVADRCTDNLNKSLYPEEYTSVPGTSSNSVLIDRPLGTFAEYKPNAQFIPTSSYSSPPLYVSLLGDKVVAFGENGEPVLSQILSTPLTFSYGGGEVSEYNNTEFALVESGKASLEKPTEFNCSSMRSPFDYQLCMNMMKCKRFSGTFAGQSYLSFCPRSTSGGKSK